MTRLVLSLLVLGLLALALPTHPGDLASSLGRVAQPEPSEPAEPQPEHSLENELEEVEADDDDRSSGTSGRVARYVASAPPLPMVPRSTEASRIWTSMATQRGPPGAATRSRLST